MVNAKAIGPSGIRFLTAERPGDFLRADPPEEARAGIGGHLHGNGSGRCAGTPTRNGGKPTEPAPSAHAAKGLRRVVGGLVFAGASAPGRDGYTENGTARSLPSSELARFRPRRAWGRSSGGAGRCR